MGDGKPAIWWARWNGTDKLTQVQEKLTDIGATLIDPDIIELSEIGNQHFLIKVLFSFTELG